MSRIFADSFYFFALMNERDEHHDEVTAWTNAFTGGLLTTEWLMLELADGMAGGPGRDAFYAIRKAFIENEKNLVIPFDMDLYRSGLELYRQRSDKQWSLTDCISFVVMKQEAVNDSLTGDRHFEQAGFRALFA